MGPKKNFGEKKMIVPKHLRYMFIPYVFLNGSQLVHNFYKYFKTCFGPVHKLFTIFSSFVHDLFTACLWLVNNFFKRISQLFHVLFRICLGLLHLSSTPLLFVHNWLTTCSQLGRNLFMTSWRLVHHFQKLFTTFSWHVYNFFMTCLAHDELSMTFPWLVH